MNTNIYNKDNKLSFYGFCCGYVERVETNENWKELYMEHSHFHVRSGKLNNKFELWETFENKELTKAKKLYQSLNLN